MSIVVAIIGFSFLILIHELGHYLAARAVGMRARKFSVGFGPAIVRVETKETVFQLAAIPIGGYVQVDGLAGSNEANPYDDLGATLENNSQPQERRPLWQRALVVSAGPAFNFGLAVLLYAGLYGSFNAVAYEWKREATTTIKEVSEPALTAGIKTHDTIESINGKRILTFKQLKRAIGENGGAPLTVVVARSPTGDTPPTRQIETEQEGLILAWPTPPVHWSRETITIIPAKTGKGHRIGVVPEFARFGSPDLAAATQLAMLETWAVTKKILITLGELFQGSEDAQVASVVKITEVGADSVKMGSEWFLSLLALLSINLGLLNLLPLPALDGGRLAFIGIEAIARKPVPPRVEVWVHGIGMLALMALMVVVMAKEIAEKF